MIANGVVVVEFDVKKVQHPTGGIVGELRVENDQHVNAGDVVVRLDETQTKANLAVFTKALTSSMRAKRVLKPKRTELSPLTFPMICWRAKTTIPRSHTSLKASASCSVSASKRGTGRRRNCGSEQPNFEWRSTV